MFGLYHSGTNASAAGTARLPLRRTPKMRYNRRSEDGERSGSMNIVHYIALDQLVRDRRRGQRKVYVIADVNGAQREEKFIRKRDGRCLIEFFPVEFEGPVARSTRRYLSLHEFDIETKLLDYVDAFYDAYSDLDLDTL